MAGTARMLRRMPEVARVPILGGWVGLIARIDATEHAEADRAAGEPWSCTCHPCNMTRRNVALMALRRAQVDAGIGAIQVQLDAAGEDLILEQGPQQ